MGFIYVTDNGATIGISGGTITIKKLNGDISRIPKETIDGISIFGNIQMTTQCTRYCLENGIRVSYFSSTGKYFGCLHSTSHTNVARLRAQIKASENVDFYLTLDKKLINTKISNQIVVAKRYTKSSSVNVENEFNQMIIAKNKIGAATSIEQIMGYEGIASKNYFGILSKIINPDFSFKGRNRQPPRDPFNSLLSLGYSIIMYEIYGELENRGLNPYIGMLHQDKENHPTLASDVMEEWRPVLIDSLVLSILQNNELTKDQFEISDENGGCYLSQEAMKYYIGKLERKMHTYIKYLKDYESGMDFRKVILHQAESLARAIDNNDPTMYVSLKIR